MEEHKLTKADIDKVRDIEGFPVAKDEDIIALSRPPYYTACPNPFIETFIRENGTPYDEVTDDYHREPFAADVSEGKYDPIYKLHPYHTKVPHRAIMRYICHYTKPGDLVFDGFSGTGMTGVAAQSCGDESDITMQSILHDEENVLIGSRKAVLVDLSPVATFLASHFNSSIDEGSSEKADYIVQQIKKHCSWMYETKHVDENGKTIFGIDNRPIIGYMNYTVWSDVFVCPNCSKHLVFWKSAVDIDHGKVRDIFHCPHCQAELQKKDCEHAKESVFDTVLGKTITRYIQVPVLINYIAGGKRYEKKPDDDDFALIKKIEESQIDTWVPNFRMIEGSEARRNDEAGITHVHQFYTKRNLITLSYFRSIISPNSPLMFALTKVAMQLTKLYRFTYMNGCWGAGGGPMSGTLYVPSLIKELNMTSFLEDAIRLQSSRNEYDLQQICISTQSCTNLKQIPSNSIDYIFTDPPFGDNLSYSELNCIWEAWLQVQTNTLSEAIVNKSQKKGIVEYQELMEKCLAEYYRILKPNRWITVEFHNSKNAVWNAIQEALLKAGFIVADIRTLDKGHSSFKQVTSQGTVKQDLVISAYKPRESFLREFQQRAGDPEMAWEFVRQHLRNVPVTADGNHDGKLDIIAERQDYLLFDRMVAWHIMNGIPVPMDAHTFYGGLRQRFLERDGMFFLPDQVNEYDDKRVHMELDIAQLSFIVTDEKNAIQWLNYILAQGPMTYQEIQPLYMQELHQSRQEKMPELLDMLKENFVQDEKGAWYVPDLTNAADLAKVRRKALLKEFWDSCATGLGKLKVFRMEAIRAGFDECWKNRDFKTIVTVGERLPEAVLQEDPALLMYYDNACGRV